MLQKVHFLVRVFMLALLPAFVMRPVVVCVHNGACHAASETHALSPASQEITLSSQTLRHIEREAPDGTTLVPRVSREKAPPVPESRLRLVSAFCLSSPKSFLVLRI